MISKIGRTKIVSEFKSDDLRDVNNLAKLLSHSFRIHEAKQSRH